MEKITSGNIVHIANININCNGGMARVAYYWKYALEQAGFNFIHLNADTIKYTGHHLGFGKAVNRHIIQKKLNPTLILCHEPFAGWIDKKGIPLISFSHGLEERAWKENLKFHYHTRSLKSFLIPDFIRFLSNRNGFRKADEIWLLNNTDIKFLQHKIQIPEKCILIPNGYIPSVGMIKRETNIFKFLYLGSWLKRKGVEIMILVFNRILREYDDTYLIIAGLGNQKEAVLKKFDSDILDRIELIESYNIEEEIHLLSQAQVLLLPSYFEGQSLVLLQAMAMGVCPIAADNSGQSDIIKHNQNGLLFETGSGLDFYDKVVFALRNKHLILEIGLNSSQTQQLVPWNKVGSFIVKRVKGLIEKSKYSH